MSVKKPLVRFENKVRKKGHVTSIWDVYGGGPDSPFDGLERRGFLGNILWWPGWRRYVFEPDGPCVLFDAKCLREIADFCEGQTLKHREAQKRLKGRQA